MNRLNGKSYAIILWIHKKLLEWKKVNIFFHSNSKLIYTIDILIKLWHSKDNIEIYYWNKLAKELWLQECKHKSHKKSTIIYWCKAYPVINNFNINNKQSRLNTIIIDDYNNYDNNRTIKRSFWKSLW